MKKYEVLKTFGKQSKGDVIEVSENLASALVKKGILKESNKKTTIESSKLTEKNIQKK